MRRFLVLLPALLALAGCGGSEDSSSEGDGSVLQTIQISLMDGSINPSTVNLSQPGTYEFEVTNDGQVTHALDVEPEGGEEAETGNLEAGASATLRVRLAEGTHEMYCPVDGHRAQGMEGAITVGNATGAGTTTDETETEDDEETTTDDDDPGY